MVPNTTLHLLPTFPLVLAANLVCLLAVAYEVERE
jgi:hypothetical protein